MKHDAESMVNDIIKHHNAKIEDRADAQNARKRLEDSHEFETMEHSFKHT
jgi:hypothetical protein